MLLYFIITGFTIWMAVESVRSGHANPWIWIILFFGPIGACVYFFAVYLGAVAPQWKASWKAAGGQDLKQAHAEAMRLDHADAWTEYAQLLRERNKHGQAVQAARTAAERDPDNLHAQYELGMGLAATGHAREAIAPLEKVTSADPGFASGEALFVLAKAQLDLDQIQNARASLEELAGRSSQPRFLYMLASVQAKCGDTEAARQSLHRIINEAELVPDYLKKEFAPWVKQARKTLNQLH